MNIWAAIWKNTILINDKFDEYLKILPFKIVTVCMLGSLVLVFLCGTVATWKNLEG